MDTIFSRNELFWGKDAQKKIAASNIFVFGLGGVGGYAAEMLVRAGVEHLTIVDFDTVSITNINRQLIALNSTVGKTKTELFKTRLTDINPNINLNIVSDFYTDNTDIFKIKPDFVVDAIDTMRSKINLMQYCVENNIPLISSMGAGNRMDPTKLYISDISEIKNKKAPFISNIIYQLKKRGIESGITVVTSSETPTVQKKISEVEHIKTNSGEDIEFTKIIPASTPFVASTAGIFMASYVIKRIIE